MKIKFLTILLFLFPVMLFAQNYEKEGDVCFEKGEYQEAEKKYKAAAALSGESSALKNKQDKSSTCFELLTKAKDAEKDENYSKAADLYDELYSFHNLSKYQQKADFLKQKAAQQVKQAEQETINNWYEQGLQYLNEGYYRDAAEWLLKAAEKGHIEAQYYLGETHRVWRGGKWSEAAKYYEKAAEQGHADAQYRLGWCYDNGYGVTRNGNTALEWYEKAAEQGNLPSLRILVDGYYSGQLKGPKVYWCKKGAKLGMAKAQYVLAECYYNGEKVEKDINQALKWCNKAKGAARDEDNSAMYEQFKKKVEELYLAITRQKNLTEWLNKGNECFSLNNFSEAITWYHKLVSSENMPEVYYKLGYCYEQTDDYQAAVRNYKKAADNGNADAQYRLGLCTEQGKGITINKNQAIEWYRKAANQEHVEAEQELNRLIKEQHIANWKKTGLEKFNTRSYEQALQLYKQAADAGDIESLYWIGNCYYMRAQYTQAIEWYRKAAEQKNADAQYRLGYCYENAQGTSQNQSEALKWYTEAAEQGHADAQYRLANCYAKGLGVTQDNTKAITWYKKAADNGNADAQYYIANCYSKGQGVAKNKTEAAKYYEKAAEQGNANAQNKIGNCYNYGIGVLTDKEEAYHWYAAAANRGNSAAKVRLTQQDYFSIWGNWEITWFGVNGSLGTGYELGASAFRVRYLWFQLNLLEFAMSERFSAMEDNGYTEPYIFYQPTLNIIFPVYDSGAVYLGMGPSWDFLYHDLGLQLKAEAGFRFNYGDNTSSDVFFRYDGYTISVGASIQWSTDF